MGLLGDVPSALCPNVTVRWEITTNGCESILGQNTLCGFMMVAPLVSQPTVYIITNSFYVNRLYLYHDSL
jgi:hypothetical protein